MRYAHIATCISILLLAISSPTWAQAASANDIDTWSTRFKDAVASGSIDGIMSSLLEVRDERLNQDGLRNSVVSFNSNFRDLSLIYATRIEDQYVGDLYHRFTTAAIYKTQHLYYTTTFMREKDAWKLVYVQMNTDLNKVVNLPWPQ